MQCLEFRDGVVIRLAFPIPKPRQESHGDYDDADADAKLCLFFSRLDSLLSPHAVQRPRFYHSAKNRKLA